MRFGPTALIAFGAALLTVGCVQERLPVVRHAKLAIIGANVVDVEAEEVQSRRTLIVEGGVIQWVGPDGGREIPAGARIVDAAGGYLMPGLADLHTHHFSRPFFGADEASRWPHQRRRQRLYDERDLALFAVNGVTLVRVMDGSQRDLQAQARLATGELIGPRFVVCAPQITGGWNRRPVGELEDAILGYHEEGYDCLKVYSGLDEERFGRVVALGDSLGLHTAGHAQIRLSLHQTLRYGSIEHIEEIQYFFGVAYGGLPITAEERGALVDELVASGAFLTPTVSAVCHASLDDGAYAALLARESSRYVPDRWVAEREAMLAVLRNRGADIDSLYLAWKDVCENALQIASVLHRAGMPFLLGTDAGPWLATPGFTVHEELETLVRVGLSAAAALRTATSIPADFLGTATGRIEPGRDAHLVLLAGNPLADIANVRRIRGVLVGDVWLDDDARRAILRALRRR